MRDHRGSPLDAAAVPAGHGARSRPAFDRRRRARSSSRRANAIDQDIIELNDAYTLLKGKHTLTVGTHNEFLKLKNLFIRDNFGTYLFTSLDNFEAGLGAAVRPQLLGDERSAAAARRSRSGSGASTPATQWRVRPNITLTYGVRIDAPTFPDEAERQSGGGRQLRLRDRRRARARCSGRPRVGLQLGPQRQRHAADPRRRRASSRAARPTCGSRTSSATPASTSRASARRCNTANHIPFVADPLNQPTTVTGATAGTFTNEIDMIDPDFKYPSVLRGNVGYDQQLPGAGSSARRLRVRRRRSRTSTTRT